MASAPIVDPETPEFVATISSPEEEQLEAVSTLDALAVLMQFAEAEGDISDLVEDTVLARLTDEVIENYEEDKRSRTDWETVAKRALEDMAKCDWGEKNFPWPRASNVHYPLLPYAVMQFNARAYPALVKGDEAVSVKVVGSDNGMPVMDQNGQPVFVLGGMPVAMTQQGPMVVTPQGMQPLPQGAQPEPAWQRPPGAKAKRAARVRDYMNTTIFYRMDGWEADTDSMLFQLPAVGCAFRKTWYYSREHKSCFIPALNLVVNNDARSLEEAPQITEEIHGVYPIHILRDIRVGKYRPIVLDPEEHDCRMLIEQQCHFDLDGDGVPEPYIVTIDHKSKQLLRVVPDFGPDQVKLVGDGLAYIERRKFYTKVEFLPHPEGKFYSIGLAHLLDQYGQVINTIINQMIDANSAIAAGGGFIASGLRIQGRGQSSKLIFRPGEYKTVDVQGAVMRDGIFERTLPNLSPVMFQLLELILGAAEQIASIKDVLTGDAKNTGQVGTTLAMIEQGLQVFTAIYKRVYRGFKDEFTLLFNNIGKYADEQAQKDYVELLDDPEANIEADFNASDFDIRPVSDPTSVTKMQRLSRAQFLMGTFEQVAAVGGDPREILRRAFEAADIEDIEKILPAPQPQPPSPIDEAQLANLVADAKKKESEAVRNIALAQKAGADTVLDDEKLKFEQAKEVAHAAIQGLEHGAAENA